MAAALTFVISYHGVRLFWKRLGMRQSKLFPAPALGQLGVAWLKQTLNRKHG
jgi:hypothetical protein